MKSARIISLGCGIVLVAFGASRLTSSACLEQSNTIVTVSNNPVGISNSGGFRFSSFTEFLPAIQLDDFKMYSNFVATVDHVTDQAELPFKSFPIAKMLSAISDKPRKIGDIDAKAPITKTNYLIRLTAIDGKRMLIEATNPGSNVIHRMSEFKPGVRYQFPNALFDHELTVPSK